MSAESIEDRRRRLRQQIMESEEVLRSLAAEELRYRKSGPYAPTEFFTATFATMRAIWQTRAPAP